MSFASASSRALRLSALGLPARAGATRLPAMRAFATSRPARASEDPTPNPMMDPRIQDFARKVHDHEGARAAMTRLGDLMKEKGIDLSQPPSAMTMLKLGMDKDVREAGQKLMEELKNAGIEITPETASQIFSKFPKE
ncbi:uncharacterized protein LOC62_06G008700 [Vanrija pseudolonga]|uniref:Uncharacterized protein n=1 Tax=Vanrija pseudolonga TaxID=143232 RepID=A0AAF0YIN4_9TREE|nr:hypothetical protein LOC62_06G008700 [Vanrija pseudolonga]